MAVLQTTCSSFLASYSFSSLSSVCMRVENHSTRSECTVAPGVKLRERIAANGQSREQRETECGT